jgi:hypothetical protein
MKPTQFDAEVGYNLGTPIKDVKWWKSFVGSVGGIYTCNMYSCLDSLLVAALKL